MLPNNLIYRLGKKSLVSKGLISNASLRQKRSNCPHFQIKSSSLVRKIHMLYIFIYNIYMEYMDVCVCVCVSALVSVSMNVYTCITCMCTVVIQISNHISSTGSMPKYYGLKNKPWNLSSLGMQYCYLFQAVSLLTAANKYFYFVYSILFFTLWHLYSISPNSFFLVDFTIHLLQ